MTPIAQDHRPPTTPLRRPSSRIATATLWIAPTLLVIGTIALIAPHAWTVGHAIYLAGAVGMIFAGFILCRRDSGTPVTVGFARAGGGLTVVGASALTVQFMIDFFVMARAGGEREAAVALVRELQRSVPLTAAVYTVGPTLLFVGLMLVGVAMLASRTALGVTLIAGSALMGFARVVDLRSLEVVALIIVTLALAGLARRWHDAVVAASDRD